MAASPPVNIASQGRVPLAPQPADPRPARPFFHRRPAGCVTPPSSFRSFLTVESRVSKQQLSQRHSRRAQAVPREELEDALEDAAEQTGPPPTYVTAPGRIVAIGDIHGDIVKAASSLCAAGVLGEEDGLPIWTGGDTVVVQIGDVLDRGDTEIGSLMLLRVLDQQAREEGGAVYMLNGNHESLNLCGNFRYVTAGGYKESAMVAGLRGHQLERIECQKEARRMLYAPGGMIARQLALNPTVLIVNDTAFAHGGILPMHVQYGLEQINEDVSSWMRGEKTPEGNSRKPPFLAMGDPNSVMWNRMFSKEKFENPWERHHVCNQLKKTLQMLQVRQMVVGHTPQVAGANCECDRRVWRVDVGMSRGVLNARPQVLEISKDEAGETYTRLLSPGNGPLPRPSFWR